MKKVFALILACAMLLALAACGTSGTAVVSDLADLGSEVPEAVAEALEGADEAPGALTLTEGTLAVGVEIGYPPMEYFDEDGTTAIGFDVEMMTEIASRMGLKLEIVDTAWDGIFAGLDSDKYDMVMSSCSITPARQENYLMGGAYVQNAIELLVPNDSDIKDIADVAGRTVAVQGETTAHDYLRDNDTGCEIMDYDKVINCFDELKLARVDSVLTDSVVAAYYLGDDINNYKVVWVNSDAEPIGVTFKKGNTALCQEIDKILDEMAADGTTAKIAEKYFGNSESVDGIRG